MDEAGWESGLLSTVDDPDDGSATPMLQVFVLPARRPNGDRDVLALKMVGELCAYSAALVETAMRRFVEFAAVVVIDLSELRFVDAAGLQLLNALAHGPHVTRLEHVDKRLSRVFEVGGLGRLLRSGPTRAAS